MITIDKLETDRCKAYAAFEEFMKESQRCFNEESHKDRKRYSNRSASQLEEDTLQILEMVKPKTAFVNSKIDLKRGHFFPDIVIDKSYGVEVKSTQENKWTSLGNSIFEGVSDEKIKDIYIMFGNLGEAPPAFKFKPYQDCLYSIAVTHSPRYLINMEISGNDSIFKKMHTEYGVFKELDDEDKIDKVRKYYIDKAKSEGKYKMPWWMTGYTDVDLSFYVDTNERLKEELKVKSFALFFSLYDNNPQTRYKEVSLWYCTHYSILCPNIRDIYTAGGQQLMIIDNNRYLCPHIVYELINSAKKIKKYLDDPDYELIKDIADYWNFKYDKNKLFDSWLKNMELVFLRSRDFKRIPIRKLIEREIYG